jgi:D-sedoheptulose 7-phosphate isomerase
MTHALGNGTLKVATAEEFSVQAYFETFSRLVPQLPYNEIQQITAVILQAFTEQRTIFIFGNGGSAATASHLMCDLNKAPISIIPYGDSRRFKVMAFTDNVPLLTAWANDLGYEHVFSEPLKNFVRHGDIVLAISSSGNSPNVIEALKTARDAGAVTLGLSGCSGGNMQPLCDVCAIVPSGNVQMVEDLHHAIAHSIVTEVRGRLVAGARRRRANLRANGCRP